MGILWRCGSTHPGQKAAGKEREDLCCHCGCNYGSQVMSSVARSLCGVRRETGKDRGS